MALRKLAGRGVLQQVGHGLYRDTTVPTSDLDQYALAVRLVGEGAFVMGDSVLAMHNLALVNPLRITVGTPVRVWRQVPTFVRTVRRVLPPEALTVDEGIAQTTIAQAITDCMEIVMPSRLREAISEAGRRHLLSAREQNTLRVRLARRNAEVHNS